MIAVVLSALVVLVVLLASRKNRGLLLRIASHVSFAVAAFSFLLGQFSFGFSRLPLFVVLTLTSTGWLLLIVRKEVARSRTQSGALNASVDMLVVVRNVVLARDLPLILPVLFGLFFVHQLSFGFGPGLVRLYQEGFGAAKPEMLYGIVLVSGTTAFIVYILVRLVQSHIGWTTIIDPALRRSIARPKD
jgi:hypothetical protein